MTDSSSWIDRALDLLAFAIWVAGLGTGFALIAIGWVFVLPGQFLSRIGDRIVDWMDGPL